MRERELKQKSALATVVDAASLPMRERELKQPLAGAEETFPWSLPMRERELKLFKESTIG